MRYITVLVAVCLICGCIGGKTDSKYTYVCPGGQMVDDPIKCNPPTTSTSSTTTSTTIDTTSTETTSTSITSTSTTMRTTTTICDDSYRGYLLITELDERCYKGYRFRMDDKRFKCGPENPECSIGLEVRKPNGQIMNATAVLSTGGITYVDSLTIEVYKAVKDGGAYIGLIKVS